MKKNKLICYVSNSKMVFRDLKTSMVFSKLNDVYNIYWIFEKGFNIKKNFDSKIKYKQVKVNFLRFHFWSFQFELSNYLYYKDKIGSLQAFPLLGMSFLKKVILRSIIRLGLIKFFIVIFRKILKITTPNFQNIFKDHDHFISFSSTKDLIYDDLIRNTDALNIKSVKILMNWDNASSKPFLEKPDFALTWGKQTSDLLLKLHGIKSKEIGSPRFDEYINYKIIARKKLKNSYKLNVRKEYIIYAGSSFPFDDIKVLNKLSKYIERKYNSKYRIIYRPHPLSWKRKNSKKNKFFNRVVLNDNFMNYDDNNLFLKFKELHNLSVALISPYSTMALESLVNGNPLMLLAINYNKNFNFNLNSQIAPHLEIFKNKNYIQKCTSFDRLDYIFDKLVSSINSKKTYYSATNLSKKIVFRNNELYKENLILNLNKIFR